MATTEAHKVKQYADGGRTRTLFEGTQKDARNFVEANFPRPHVELGDDRARADVVLVSPDGTSHEYHGVGAAHADANGYVEIDDEGDIVPQDEEE